MAVYSSSNSSLHPPLDNCPSRTSIFIFTAVFISYILLLPLFILILYMGCQRWTKQRSVATAAKTSHSDVLTFNMVVLELICVFGSSLYCYGAYTNRQSVAKVGFYILSLIFPGQALFHLLTSVERYLAVVHPITYRGLRQAGGVRIRNISIGCVWLLCFGSKGLSELGVHFNIIYASLLLLFSFVIVSFCCFSVLCVLIRPGPGEVGGKRQRVGQSKQRAFQTMMVIMGALTLKFLSSMISNVIYASSVLNQNDHHSVLWSLLWLSLPSSLVLPLLFLHRAGKLPGCKQSTG